VDKIKLNSPDEQLEDVRLCVFDAHGTRASASDQALEVLAGQQQVALEAVHQLGKIKTSNVSWKNRKVQETHLGSFFVGSDEEFEIGDFSLLEGLQLLLSQLECRSVRGRHRFGGKTDSNRTKIKYSCIRSCSCQLWERGIRCACVEKAANKNSDTGPGQDDKIDVKETVEVKSAGEREKSGRGRSCWFVMVRVSSSGGATVSALWDVVGIDDFHRKLAPSIRID